MMRKALFMLMLMLALPALADDLPDYQIEGAGTGAQGTYLVNVSVLTKKSKLTDDEIGRCAIHGVLFRGFANKELRQQQKPLAGSALVEGQNKACFDPFFEKDYANYYQVLSGSRKVVKAGKQYKITSTVTVAKEQLRKDLSEAGVIKSLNNMF